MNAKTVNMIEKDYIHLYKKVKKKRMLPAYTTQKTFMTWLDELELKDPTKMTHKELQVKDEVERIK